MVVKHSELHILFHYAVLDHCTGIVASTKCRSRTVIAGEAGRCREGMLYDVQMHVVQ